MNRLFIVSVLSLFFKTDAFCKDLCFQNTEKFVWTKPILLPLEPLALNTHKRFSGQSGRDDREGSLDNIAAGVILRFNRWPGEKEKSRLFKTLDDMGLKRRREIHRDLKMWAANWPGDPRDIKEARDACEKLLSQFSILKYCEPNGFAKGGV